MKRTLICALFATAACAAPASAETAWGLRGGVTFDPDQVHVGAHLNAGELFENGYFLPNLEIGFGDNLTVVALNPELVYRFTKRGSTPWGFYVGGGLGINFVSWDDGDFPGRGDTSDTDLGLNILGGMSRRLSQGNDFFVELKLGLADSPDAKITAGLTFF
jgi:opacity protein-like surface antigen